MEVCLLACQQQLFIIRVALNQCAVEQQCSVEQVQQNVTGLVMGGVALAMLSALDCVLSSQHEDRKKTPGSVLHRLLSRGRRSLC